VLNITDFINNLKSFEIKSLIDIRANPMPVDYPEYDRGHLHQFCENNNISYHWAGRQLGESVATNKSSQHEALLDKSMRDYADFMATKGFQIAAAQIMNMAYRGKVAVFSKMSDMENNFRFLLADYLVLQGLQVSHILSTNDVREHYLHKNARRESVELIYDNID